MAVTLTRSRHGSIRKITVAVVADGVGGIADTILPAFEGTLLALQVVPGSPAPTAGFDVLVLQGDYDVLERTGINPSNTDPTRAVVRYAGTNCHPAIDETDVLVLRIRDSVEAGAVLSVRIFYSLGYR